MGANNTSSGTITEELHFFDNKFSLQLPSLWWINYGKTLFLLSFNFILSIYLFYLYKSNLSVTDNRSGLPAVPCVRSGEVKPTSPVTLQPPHIIFSLPIQILLLQLPFSHPAMSLCV